MGLSRWVGSIATVTVPSAGRGTAMSRRVGSFVLAENNVVIDQPITGKPAIVPNDYRGFEFCGATFAPSGRQLFVNIQTPGITFAIDGPWHRGSL
jgi:hypothetical protein